MRRPWTTVCWSAFLSFYLIVLGIVLGDPVRGAQGVKVAAPAEDANVPAVDEANPVLSGRIVDDTGVPVTDARVETYPSRGGSVHSTRTNSDGRYSFASVSDAGEYRLRILSSRWIGFSDFNEARKLQLNNDAPTKKDFTLQRAALARVQVVDEGGTPLPNVMLYAGPLGNSPNRSIHGMCTEQDGSVIVGGLKPSKTPYLIAVFPSGNQDFGFVKLEITLDKPGVEEKRTLTVPKGVDVHGTAICSDGNPPGGWRIVAMPTWWRFGVSQQGVLVTPDGSFTLKNITPGEYTLQLSIPTGDHSTTLRPISEGMKLTDQKQPLALKIDYPSRESMTFIMGRVRLPEDAMTQGFWIHARSEDGKYTGYAQVRPGQDYFQIDPIPRGKYRIDINSNEFEQKTISDVTAPSDDLEIELKLKKPTAPAAERSIVPRLFQRLFAPSAK